MSRNGFFLDPFGNILPDTKLEETTRAALRASYDLRPVGSETKQQLEDRIIGAFLNAYAVNWNADTPPSEIIGDVNFHEVVRSISPLSVRKAASTAVGPADFTRPTVGAVEAPPMNYSQWLSLLRLGWQAYTDTKGRAVAMDLAQKQAAGQKLYIPSGVQANAAASTGSSVWTWVIGGAAAVGLVALVAYIWRKK